ncbi:hypothetical protein OFM36_31755, partial [Escherichia coli]|nr:hypothetical protein [Escherichia coli]
TASNLSTMASETGPADLTTPILRGLHYPAVFQTRMHNATTDGNTIETTIVCGAPLTNTPETVAKPCPILEVTVE